MKTENYILFTGIPTSEQLKYFLGVLDFNEKPFLNPLSDYNWQKIKTRCLLENRDDILAAPVHKKISQIHIIFPGGYSERDLKDFMINNKISLNGPHPLQNEIYLECILYTLTFKLKEWKRMNKYFLRGQHFLNNSQAVEAVRLQLLITDGCLALSSWALRVKLPSMNLIDLGVDLKGLYREGFAVISQKVLTLPNLKQATAICVYLTLPLSCSFRNYDDIRNYWMRLYGYNLPHNKEAMLYVEVTFNSSNFTYIYPIICVCPYEPIQLRCKDEFGLINDFTEALRKDFPKICTYGLEINIKNDNIFHPISKLYMASEVIDKPNLSLLLSDTKVIQDYQKENMLSMPRCESNKRCRSPPLFLPSFQRIPPLLTPKPSNEPFKCYPVFNPKNKEHTQSQNPTKRLKTSPKKPQRNSQKKKDSVQRRSTQKNHKTEGQTTFKISSKNNCLDLRGTGFIPKTKPKE